MPRLQYPGGFTVVALLLAGCGGGGGSDPAPNPAPGPTVSYSVGGTATGLVGSGLVLQNNGGNNLIVTTNGTFTFGAPQSGGSSYAVSVLTQPSSPAQTCTVTGGTGAVGSANVTTVAVTCAAPLYTVGGTVMGLTGTGLVLQNNGGNNLSLTTNGPFAFTTGLATGVLYAVTVLSQPSNQPQQCSVANGSGAMASANVTVVSVTCVPLVFTPISGRLVTPRGLHTATLLNDGKVLITGGVTNSALTATNTAELFDPTTGTSAAVGNMNAVRNQHTATLLANGTVLITGGSNHGDGDGTSTAEVYNPATQTFAPIVATLNTPRGGHTASLLPNGTVVIIGGFNNSSTALNSAEIYNPAAQTFTPIAALMIQRRSNHRASTLLNGQVLISGGHSDDIESTSVETFIPTSSTFAPSSAVMTIARGVHSATTLANGNVLVVGGAPDYSPTNFTSYNTAELYRVSTNVFTALSATLTTARGGQGATLLTNGRVLITGGVTGANSPATVLDTIELYGP